MVRSSAALTNLKFINQNAWGSGPLMSSISRFDHWCYESEIERPIGHDSGISVFGYSRGGWIKNLIEVSCYAPARREAGSITGTANWRASNPKQPNKHKVTIANCCLL